MLAGVEHIGGGQAERIDGAVRDLHRAEQRRVNRGSSAAPRGRHGLRLNTRRWQAVIKVC
jgi:hypothetical protein